jgi:L-alanine-DL-glutamate epimerase-like enolase superfamily enzyme
LTRNRETRETQVKITTVETIRPAVQPNLLFVLLHTDEGLTGLGEAFFGAPAVEEYLHSDAARVLAAVSDPTPGGMAGRLTSYVGYQGAGVETRGNAAIDLALWDLQGKRAGLPLVDLLGGAVRERLPIYNTCAGSGYVSRSTRQEAANWGIRSDDGDTPPFEDLHAFLEHPARLARELWDEGIRGMKVWPFDQAAERSNGTDITPVELARGVAVIDQIRAEVGPEMLIMLEMHGLWNHVAAKKIIDAVSPYNLYWVEDPMRPDSVDALAHLASEVAVPIAIGETCVGRRGFLPLLQARVVDIATVDVQWTGGLTEARKVASLADTFGVPIAPHDCTGPATLAACVALAASQPNGLIQETTRSFLRTWYGAVAEGFPEPAGGFILPTGEPGHGVRVSPALLADAGAHTRRVTRL